MPPHLVRPPESDTSFILFCLKFHHQGGGALSLWPRSLGGTASVPRLLAVLTSTYWPWSSEHTLLRHWTSCRYSTPPASRCPLAVCFVRMLPIACLPHTIGTPGSLASRTFLPAVVQRVGGGEHRGHLQCARLVCFRTSLPWCGTFLFLSET